MTTETMRRGASVRSELRDSHRSTRETKADPGRAALSVRCTAAAFTTHVLIGLVQLIGERIKTAQAPTARIVPKSRDSCWQCSWSIWRRWKT